MHQIKFIKQWLNSWIKLIPLNWPYVRARLAGYNYYIEVGIDINPRKPQATTTQEVQQDMENVGADVRMVRWVKRRNHRAASWRLFAVFKDEESAILFKLQEGNVGNFKKFEGWAP